MMMAVVREVKQKQQREGGESMAYIAVADMYKGGFLVGEAWDHDAGNGQPRYTAYYKAKGFSVEKGTHVDIFMVSNRPMTRAEFRREMNERDDLS